MKVKVNLILWLHISLDSHLGLDIYINILSASNINPSQLGIASEQPGKLHGIVQVDPCISGDLTSYPLPLHPDETSTLLLHPPEYQS